MTCPECKYTYAESDAGDQRNHLRIHDETMNGLPISQFRSCQQTGSFNKGSVLIVNQKSPLICRELAQSVSLLAGIGFFNVAYAATEPPDERNIHLFIGIEGERARSFLSFERRTCVVQCTWDEYNSHIYHKIDEPIWTIGFAWVGRAHRRKGWVRRTVRAASDHLGFGDLFAWYRPFTPDGEATARGLCHSGIYIAK